MSVIIKRTPVDTFVNMCLYVCCLTVRVQSASDCCRRINQHTGTHIHTPTHSHTTSVSLGRDEKFLFLKHLFSKPSPPLKVPLYCFWKLLTDGWMEGWMDGWNLFTFHCQQLPFSYVKAPMVWQHLYSTEQILMLLLYMHAWKLNSPLSCALFSFLKSFTWAAASSDLQMSLVLYLDSPMLRRILPSNEAVSFCL